jgi:hypothetical protein
MIFPTPQTILAKIGIVAIVVIGSGAAGAYIDHKFNRSVEIQKEIQVQTKYIESQQKAATVVAKTDKSRAAAVTAIKKNYEDKKNAISSTITPKDDSIYRVPNKFVWLWNDASGMSSAVPAGATSQLADTPSTIVLSDITRTHDNDAEQYSLCRDQVNQWVNFYRGVQEANKQ